MGPEDFKEEQVQPDPQAEKARLARTEDQLDPLGQQELYGHLNLMFIMPAVQYMGDLKLRPEFGGRVINGKAPVALREPKGKWGQLAQSGQLEKLLM